MYTLCIHYVYALYTLGIQCVYISIWYVFLSVQWCTDMHECTCICVVRIYPITCPRTYILVRYMWKSVLIILYIYIWVRVSCSRPPLPHIWYVGLPPLLYRGEGYIDICVYRYIFIHTVYKDICTYTYYIRIHTHMYVYIYIFLAYIYI